MATTAPAPYYDPYDFDIDADPYPVWKRLRDEAPLYVNEKYDFYTLSRYEDVEKAFVDWQTYSSAQGIGARDHQGRHRDAAGHVHLRGSARPRPAPRTAQPGLHAAPAGRHRAPGPGLRGAHARPARRTGGFDFIADLGAEIPMRTIGMLLGIPEEDQQEIRNHIDDGLRLDEGVMPELDLASAGRRLRLTTRPTSSGGRSIPPTTS